MKYLVWDTISLLMTYLPAPDTRSFMSQSEYFSGELGKNILLATYVVTEFTVFQLSCCGF